MEQDWPQIDMDYNLELVCKVNHQEWCSVKIPRHQLDQLDQSTAMAIFEQQEAFIKHCSSRRVLKTDFRLYPGIQAALTLAVEEKNKLVAPAT